jgi:hypothetical protein
MFKKFRFLVKDIFKQFRDTESQLKNYQDEIMSLNKELKEKDKESLDDVTQILNSYTKQIQELNQPPPKIKEKSFKGEYQILEKLENIKIDEGGDALEIFKTEMSFIPEMFYKGNTDKLKEGDIEKRFRSRFSQSKWKEVENTMKQYNHNIGSLMFLIVSHSFEGEDIPIINEDIKNELKEKMGEENWNDIMKKLEDKGESIDKIIENEKLKNK